MKYAITRQDGVTELREDSYPLQINAIQLLDVQYDQLMNGSHIIENGQIVANPNLPRSN